MKSLFAEPEPIRARLVPKGYNFASMACGLKKSRRMDLALIASERPATAAAVFTTNRFKAAPVLVCAEHLRRSGSVARAIIANSGNANCATGEAGLAAARATAERLAEEIGCPPEHVLVCSTGIIGAPLEVHKILKSVPDLVGRGENSPGAAAGAAAAIMTTDTRRKWSTAGFRIGSQAVSLLGIAKGSGMIHPQMATMFAFIASDAAIGAPLASRMLRAVSSRTFNSVTVDGDTSTNDTVLLLANGASGAAEIRPGSADAAQFERALEKVCKELALAIVADGEGASRVASIEVQGAPSDAAAAEIAVTIANSPLVKTAIAGADPNWGRILAAAGRARLPKGVQFEMTRVDVRLAGLLVCRDGAACRFNEQRAHRRMLDEYVPIVVDLKGGTGRATAWTCDLTDEYVRINTAYRT